MAFTWWNPRTWNSDNEFKNGFYFNNIIGQKDVPIWVDVSRGQIQNIYETIPHVRIVIDRLASMFANARVVITDLDGNKIENQQKNEFWQLLESPNPLQSREEFFSQFFIYQSLYGAAFTNKIGINGNTRVMWNLPSQYMQVIPTGKIFKQVALDDIIKGYVLDLGNGTEEKYLTDEILMSATPSPESPIIGLSKIESLQKPISNIKAVLDKSNVILNRLGAIGILSNEAAKDGAGALPFNPAEKKRVHDQYQKNYGNGNDKMSLIISEANLKWQSMSYPTKDLMLFEELESDFGQIIDAFGADRDLFSSTKGATFENKNEAQKKTYQETIIPFANDRAKALSAFIGAEDKGFRVNLDYSHLPVMQENEEEKSKVLLNKTNAINTLIGAGFNDVANELAESLKDKKEAK